MEGNEKPVSHCWCCGARITYHVNIPKNKIQTLDAFLFGDGLFEGEEEDGDALLVGGVGGVG